MVRRERLSPDDWEAEGSRALLHLLGDQLVVTPFEAESRISVHGWHDFRRVQPLQLHGSRLRLREDEAIVEETTGHSIPVHTIRMPYSRGSTRLIERARGHKRRLYLKYLSWANNQEHCGHHAERVVHASLVEAGPRARIFVPDQRVGDIRRVNGLEVPGSLDTYCHILNETVASDAVLAGEVKNVNHWIYPCSSELWELLIKTARMANDIPLLPVLFCMRMAWSTGQMGKDIGFLACEFENQLFSPHVDPQDFQDVTEAMALTVTRHDGPHPNVVDFLTRILRLRAPTLPDEDIPWYRRQVQRFRALAPVILNFEALAGNLPEGSRSEVFLAFKAQATATLDWPRSRGW